MSPAAFSFHSKTMYPRYFDGLTEEMIKFKRHLRLLRLTMVRSSGRAVELKGCYEYWVRLARMIDQDFDGRDRIWQAPCHNPRCPDPDAWSPMRYLCNGCLDAMYCSKRCQIWHWGNPIEKSSHKAQCRGRHSPPEQDGKLERDCGGTAIVTHTII